MGLYHPPQRVFRLHALRHHAPRGVSHQPNMALAGTSDQPLVYGAVPDMPDMSSDSEEEPVFEDEAD